MIDLVAAVKLYEREEIPRNSHIRRLCNCADQFEKGSQFLALNQILE